MDKFLEKFGLFDIFSMLIPGIFFMTFLLYLRPDLVTCAGGVYYSNAAKIFLFFAMSYFVGVLFHELWRVLGEIGRKCLKRKDIREKYLLPKGNIIHNELDYKLAEAVKRSIISDNNLIDENVEEEVKNKFVFNYCMNVLEMEGMSGKQEKMQIISEMSASLFLESFILEVVYLVSAYKDIVDVNIFKITVLFGCIIIFYIRKKRYARYRITNLMRTYYIAMKKRNYEKS